MSKKTRRGMHIRINWPILRAGVPEDFTTAESLTLHISRVNNNVKTFIPDTHISITGNVVSFIITSEMQKALMAGEYKATIAYRKVSATSPTLWEPYIKDEPCFSLVDSSAEVGGSTIGMEVVTIELDGEIGLPKEALPGASAYQIALAHGFEGDEAEWLLSLKQPAIDAAGLAIQAAGAADAAAGKANTATSELDAIKQFLSQAESGRNTAEENRETKEGQRQQTEQARLTSEQNRKTAEENRETKEGQRQETEQARLTSEQNRKTAEENRETKEGQRQETEQARLTSEQNRKTAEENRETKEGERQRAEQFRAESETTRGTTFDQKIQSATDATSAANAAANAQNTYNVTVAVPLAAGVYYNSSSARLAVPVVSRKRGLVLTYETTAGTWYAERFKGTDIATWTTAANWEQVPDAAQLALKADLLNGTVPAEQLPPDLIRTTLYLTQVGHRKRRIQDSAAVEDGTMLWSIVSGTEYLAALPDTLGLGLYLVSQDLTLYKKLSKTNSNIYADGTPAKLDGTEGDIQMCWRKPIYIKYYEKQETDGLYEHIEISHLNILGECEMIAPGGGFPAVLNRTTGDLRALYSTDPNYRGGNNTASYDSDPVKTLIGKPATNLSAYSGEVAAKKRGPLWTTGGTPFFATLAILQIMLFGTNDSQGAIVTDDVLVDGEGFQSCKKDVNKLFSGGFGVSNSFPSWSTYNAYNPTFDLSAGFTRGDITGKKVYKIKDWPIVGTNQTISLAYFFGMPYPFNHYWHGDAHQRVDQQTEAQGFKTVVYQKRDITTIPISGGPSLNGVVPPAPWEKVAEASRTEGYIRRTSFNVLCLIPTVAGSPGSSNKFYPDYFYNNGTTSFGWRAPLRFAYLDDGAYAGAFHVHVNYAPTYAFAYYGAFCCHFISGTVPKKMPG